MNENLSSSSPAEETGPSADSSQQSTHSSTQTFNPSQQPASLPDQQHTQRFEQLSTPAAAPAQASTAHPVTTSFVAVWSAFILVLRGNPVQAFAIAQRVHHLWLVAFGVAALTTGLFLATNTARTIGAANTFVNDLVGAASGFYYSSYGGQYFGLAIGDWFLLVLVGFLFAAIAFLLRAVVLHWLFIFRGAKQPFKNSANILSVAYAGHVIVFAAAFVLSFIPSGFIVSLVTTLTALSIGLLSFAAELWIYVGINRTAYMSRSAVLPHTLLTGVWILLTFFSFLILIVGALSSIA